MEKNIFPVCAVGTWAWGKGLIGGKMVFGKPADKEVLKDTFRKACELGFTLWDTAEVYGMGSAEEILAECISEAKKNGTEIMISTKHMPSKIYRSGSVREALLKSLHRLGADHADLYWLHLPNNIEQNVRELAGLMKEGLVKRAGVSNYDLDQIKYAGKLLKDEGLALDAVQNHFSLIRRDVMQRRIIEYCGENGITYFSYMVLEQGALTGHYSEKKPFPKLSLRGLEYNGKWERLRPLTDYIWELSERYCIDPSQIAIAWAISKNTVPIVGMTKTVHAERLGQGCRLTLTEGEILKMEELAERSGIVSKGVWEPKIGR
ncbi:MAG: aldo/keto reductase [Ruminococcus sp.]|nr:aldo/keto reductase [Ruminococcus sp.]